MSPSRIRVGSIKEAIEASQRIPEFDQPYPIEEYLQRLIGVPHLILIAEVKGEIAGFKVGYQRDSETFYSWMGGVLPDHRGLHLASDMLKAQEKWAIEQGYQQLRVKSRNRYASMVAMLLRYGYQIDAFEPKGDSLADHRLHLCKTLIADQ